MSSRSREPTAGSKPDPRGRGDTPPPAPPRELPGPDPGPRMFVHEGRQWVARISGKGAWGTGSYGLGLVEAVHFADAAAPDVPLREALLPRGRFEALFDDELAGLLATATPITPEAGRP